MLLIDILEQDYNTLIYCINVALKYAPEITVGSEKVFCLIDPTVLTDNK